jgi:hypothetical protein
VAHLDLKIEGPPGTIAASVLARALAESVSILADLRSAITHSRTSITWFVQELRTDSAAVLLVSSPKEDIGESDLERIASAYVDGFKAIQTGDALPAYLSEASLNRVHSMATPLGRGAEAITVAAGRNGLFNTVRVTHLAADNVKTLMAPRSRALGSVTGRLEAVTLHYKMPKFHIYDDLANRPVACQFAEDSLDMIRTALGKRIRVGGVVIRNAKGQAIGVDDPVIEFLGDGRDLTELVGLDPDCTAGKSLAEYMEEHVG